MEHSPRTGAWSGGRLAGWYLVGWLGSVLLAGAAEPRAGSSHSGSKETSRYRVMTYNLENYLLADTATRPGKSKASREKVAESISAGHPDIVALQEVGSREALSELQGALRKRGLDLPQVEFVSGWDTNISVAVLSRFPLVHRNPHRNENFLLHGRRWHMSRGVAEVEIAVTPRYHLTLFTTHLKSKRALSEASEQEVREQEAMVLRELVVARLAREPNANVLVCGDFNDTRDTPTVRTILGDREPRLFDPRPAEPNGDRAPGPAAKLEPRRITWTHYYGKEDTYSRIDYLLLARGLKREWCPEGTGIVVLPDWGVASDHRPVVAEFLAEDR